LQDAVRRNEKMSKEELIQFDGLVIEILPDARYRVHLDAGYEVVAYTASKMKKNRIKTLVGDRVTIEMSPRWLIGSKPSRTILPRWLATMMRWRLTTSVGYGRNWGSTN
jgi:translation initiation factor IF-1